MSVFNQTNYPPGSATSTAVRQALGVSAGVGLTSGCVGVPVWGQKSVSIWLGYSFTVDTTYSGGTCDIAATGTVVVSLFNSGTLIGTATYSPATLTPVLAFVGSPVLPANSTFYTTPQSGSDGTFQGYTITVLPKLTP